MGKKIELYKKYFFELFVLSIPLIVGNISQVLLGAIDVFVAAKHSLDTLSSISIGSSVMTCIFIVGIGFMSSISPVVANYRGARKPSKQYLYSSIVYSLVLSAFFGILTLAIVPLVPKMGFEEHLVYHIQEYIFICAFSYFGAYLHFSLKEFLQAYEIVVFPNVVAILGIFLNLVLNFAFVFGFWFIPSMGVKGLAIATLAVRTFMGLILLWYTLRLMNLNIKLSKSYLTQLIKVGYPISIALALEFFAFHVITIMVPLAISNAIAIKVGYANGARDYSELKRFSIAGVLLTIAFMLFCALFLNSSPEFFVKLFTDEKELLMVSVPVIYVVALYQIFDGAQVAFSGILKGLKMTKLVSASIFCAYWVMGLPLGFLFAFHYHMDLLGFWIALAISLLIMGVILLSIILVKFAKLRKEFEKQE